MNKPIRIVGHGLAGCVMAMTLVRHGVPFTIVGCSLPGEASMASSGLIAPITGRRYVKAWRIDEFLEQAKDFYPWTENILGQRYFFPVDIVRYLAHPEAKIAYARRLDDPEYEAYISAKTTPLLDGLGKPYGILTGGYRLDTPGWIQAVRQYLKSKELLTILDHPFTNPDPEAEHIIWATGATDPGHAPRVIPNKGESLVVKMTEWNIKEIIKEEVFIIPLGDKDMYWVGSFYDPWPENKLSTNEGRERILQCIKKVYPGPIEVMKHMVGVRPTVNDRRPFIGPFPNRPGQFILNGMGTKGTSLAPYWAEQLMLHILNRTPLSDEVWPDRHIS